MEGFERVEIGLDRVVEDTSNRRGELAGMNGVRRRSMPLSLVAVASVVSAPLVAYLDRVRRRALMPRPERSVCVRSLITRP